MSKMTMYTISYNLLFGSNEQVRMVYRSLLQDKTTEGKEFLLSSINILDAKIEENKGDDLCYETGAKGDVVATMRSENSWTKRLVGCLRNILPKLTDRIHYTGDDVLEFASIQSKISSLPANLSGCYPFQGAPDITIHHSISICNDCTSYEENGSSDESGDSEIIEHGLSKIPEEQHCPKLGQLVAGMHMILVRKVRKKFLSGKASVKQTSVSTKGIFLNRGFGAMLCTLLIPIGNGATTQTTTPELHIDEKMYGALSPETLCCYLTRVFEHKQELHENKQPHQTEH